MFHRRCFMHQKMVDFLVEFDFLHYLCKVLFYKTGCYAYRETTSSCRKRFAEKWQGKGYENGSECELLFKMSGKCCQVE